LGEIAICVLRAQSDTLSILEIDNVHLRSQHTQDFSYNRNYDYYILLYLNQINVIPIIVTIITGHLILTKNSKSDRFVHFFARERQSDSPRKTSTLRCQVQAQRPTFYIDCRKSNVFSNI
jgi:hypothetical protein